MAEFEEYRQPWETGPHWELKREFMDKYQNDYPLDRLLCLAQAYSNIELLHCSYPEPVMREVYQLSCQLQGCKRFREADADLERRRKEKAEMQPRKAGKRSLSDEISTKPFKFIKFCSGDGSANLSKSNNETDKNSNKLNQCDIITSASDSSTAVDSDGLKTDIISENTFSTAAAISNNNNNDIFSISHSPDISLIQKIASAMPKKTGNPLGSIESAIEVSGLENEIKFVFVRENAAVISCQFYIGKTLISTGRDTTEKLSKERAAVYGFEVLNNLSNLPHKTLDDVKIELENWKKANSNSNVLWSEMSSSDLELKSKILISQLSEMEKNPVYADLHFILSFVEKLLKYPNNKNMSAVQKIQEAAAKLKCTSQVCFLHFGEDPDTLLHCRLFHCDFVLKNIFICHSKSSGKKKAKGDAVDQGFQLLINFIENRELEEEQNGQEKFLPLKINIESSKHIVSVADKIPENIKTSVPDTRCDNEKGCLKNKLKTFSINHRLLSNSRHQQLIIFDISETSVQNPANAIINCSAARCKKDLNYVKEETCMDTSRNSQKIHRCSVTLNKQTIGTAQGFSEKEAKSNAAEVALQFLQKNVYTIKVKNEVEESFIISRSHVLNAENPSSVLAESNVGCKMLKMMGWTGGGIGKTSGITEPIVANDHRFGQGLGFSNDKAQERSFKQKVDTLLKDYSRSNTTSDLIFSTEFSKEERKEIHKLATRYNLSSNSRGKKGGERQLFIGQKLSPMELLEHLIRAGGSTPKYELEDRSVSDGT